MLSRLLSRYGLVGATALVTAASIVASVVVGAVVMALVLGAASGVGLLVSALVAGVCAPVFTYAQLKLVVELQRAKEELRRLSVIDDLSQAFNRRHFFELADQELARAARYGTPCAVVIFDLDAFKELNDRLGHAAGDVLLRAVSDTCRGTIRAYDIFARLGGEEFVLLLPSTTEAGAIDMAERVRRRIADHPVMFEGETMRATASFGVASLANAMPNLDSLMRWADQAMYASKRAGRNCTCVAHVAPREPHAIRILPASTALGE